MKKLLVVILMIMTCVGMSGVAPSLTSTIKQTDITVSATDLTSKEKTNSNAMEQLTKSVYTYLNMDENPYDNQEEYETTTITAPWIFPASDIFQWWIRVVYNGVPFEQQLDISIKDFQEKFLKHPYYSEDVFFNVDDDLEDDLKVSFGFYWESILNTKTHVEHKSLEDMVKVRQLNGGPADLYAGLEVWSEIHVNWGLINEVSSNTYLSSQRNSLTSSTPVIPHFIKSHSLFAQLLKQKAGQRMFMMLDLLKKLLGTPGEIFRAETQPEHGSDPEPMPADNDYFAVGVGYRTEPGERIPQYVEKRFAFAKENIFSPAIFQQVMKTEPSGVDPPSSYSTGSDRTSAVRIPSNMMSHFQCSSVRSFP